MELDIFIVKDSTSSFEFPLVLRSIIKVTSSESEFCKTTDSFFDNVQPIRVTERL